MNSRNKKIINPQELHIPIKASKNYPLTEIQKDFNCNILRIRVVIENEIAKIKAFFILRIENRMRINQKLDDEVHIRSSLANFKRNLLIINV